MKTKTKENIYVTKSFLPPKEEFCRYIDDIYSTCLLTNQGPLLKKLEKEISKRLNLTNFHYITNGTIALQLALKALEIENCEVITTPFSYVATVSSILWQNCKPIFVDIEPDNFTIDVNKIEEKITKNTKAILPVHVFGYACDVNNIQKIANAHSLKVIYDAAHAFGSFYNGKSLLSYGDISTCSFHATKLFHTIEGGACIVKDKKISDRLELMKKFGLDNDKHICLGINAKQTEFNAAMGLSILPHLSSILQKRMEISKHYDKALPSKLQRPKKQPGLDYNWAYYPIVFKTNKEMKSVITLLQANNIYPRRYFYPSLNKLPYLKDKTQTCPICESITSRILCLPLYNSLKEEDIDRIINLIREVIK